MIQLTHTREELADKLALMEAAARAFYRMAQMADFHQFLEHAGIMNEHVKICRAAAAQGIDFATTAKLPIQTYEAAYIGEKVGCIFGESFGVSEELIRYFCRAAFGVEVKVDGPDRSVG